MLEREKSIVRLFHNKEREKCNLLTNTCIPYSMVENVYSMYRISNILEMQVAEFIFIQVTFIFVSSWKWWHFFKIFKLLFFKIRLRHVKRNRNIPVLTDVVQHATHVDNLAHLQWRGEPHLASKDTEAAFELSNASLCNTPCLFMSPEKKYH